VNVGLTFGAKLATTKAVDAALVELSPAVAVGTVTVPVNVGEDVVAKVFRTTVLSPEPVFHIRFRTFRSP
jgi:hypothetical protein